MQEEEERTVVPVSTRYDPSKTETGEYELLPSAEEMTVQRADQAKAAKAKAAKVKVIADTRAKYAVEEKPVYRDIPGYGKVRIPQKLDVESDPGSDIPKLGAYYKAFPGQEDKETGAALNLAMESFELSGEEQPFEGLDRDDVKKTNRMVRGWIDEYGAAGAAEHMLDYVHNLGTYAHQAGKDQAPYVQAQEKYLQHLLKKGHAPIMTKRLQAQHGGPGEYKLSMAYEKAIDKHKTAQGAVEAHKKNVGPNPIGYNAKELKRLENNVKTAWTALVPIRQKARKAGVYSAEDLAAKRRFHEVPGYAKQITHYKKPDGTIVAAEDLPDDADFYDWEGLSTETDQETRIRLAGEYLDAVKTQFAKRGEEVPAGFDQELAGMSTAAIIRGINEIVPVHAEEGALAISLAGDPTRRGKRLRKQQESHALSTGKGPKGNKARVKFTTTTEEVPTANALAYEESGGKRGIKDQTKKVTKRTAQVFFQGEGGYDDAESIVPGDPRFQQVELGGTVLEPPKGGAGRRVIVGAKEGPIVRPGEEATLNIGDFAVEAETSKDPVKAFEDRVMQVLKGKGIVGAGEDQKVHLGKLSFDAASAGADPRPTLTEGGVGALVSLAYGLYDTRSPEEREAGKPPKWKHDPDAKISKTAELLLKGMYSKYQDLQKESVRLNGLAAKSREKLNGAKDLYADAQRDGNSETIKAAKQALNRVQKIYNSWAHKSRVTNNSVAKFRPIMSPYGHARNFMGGKSAEEEAAAGQLTRDEAALKAAEAQRAAKLSAQQRAAEAKKKADAERRRKRNLPPVPIQESLRRNKNKAFKIRIKRRKK